MKGETFIIFLSDGRFHLDSEMISNPFLPALRYDLYEKTLTDERYDTKAMKTIQRGGIDVAVIPDSVYLESLSATWDDREIL